MKKRITVLAIDEEISLFFKNEINSIFSNLFEVDYRHPDMEPVPPVYNTDLILYTDPEILNILISIIKCDAPTLMMKRTITREALKQIKEIPSGSKVLITNINQYMANETMALIYQLGITNIKLYPYYEGKRDFPAGVDYIIVPEQEEYDFLPDLEAEILLIGNRVFDVSNVLDILSILRVDGQRSEEILRKYLLTVPTFWYGFEYSWENRRVLLNQWKLLLDELSNGVIVVDAHNQIELINDKAKKILSIESDLIIGQKVEEMIEKNQDLRFILTGEEKSDELIRYKDRDLIVTIKLVRFDNNYYGKIIIIHPYTEMVEVQQKIHKKIVGKGHYSRHHFSDLIGEDPNFIRAVEIGKKISSSNSTVLLLGDSGTGKELFAGAVHNYSPRKNKPFVAINCATLPENLLESELFGYEKGAFTGANKSGKIGLIERAHQGTLFLDEIGDLPLKLQARLLRAIEEKEIMRIGGSSVISVDVRIIAATNRDLIKLVEDKKFRKDLFYRINVFQIQIPSLSERTDDIPLLIENYLEKWGIERESGQDFINFYNNYSWPGNVRELINVLEYMTTISDSELTFDNLPDYLKKREYYVDNKNKGEYLLLKILYYCCQAGGNTGRRTLNQLFNKLYYKISELEVRELIKRLSQKGELETRRGRAGNCITEKGVKRLREDGFINDIEGDFLKKIEQALRI